MILLLINLLIISPAVTLAMLVSRRSYVEYLRSRIKDLNKAVDDLSKPNWIRKAA